MSGDLQPEDQPRTGSIHNKWRKSYQLSPEVVSILTGHGEFRPPKANISGCRHVLKLRRMIPFIDFIGALLMQRLLQPVLNVLSKHRTLLVSYMVRLSFLRYPFLPAECCYPNGLVLPFRSQHTPVL